MRSSNLDAHNKTERGQEKCVTLKLTTEVVNLQTRKPFKPMFLGTL